MNMNITLKKDKKNKNIVTLKGDFSTGKLFAICHALHQSGTVLAKEIVEELERVMVKEGI